MEQYKKWIGFCLRVAISIGILVYLFYRIDWQEVPKSVQGADYKFIVAALFATNMAIVISALKWHLLCKQTSGVTFWESLRWYYIGFFSSNFLPGSIGGDVLRIYYSSKKMGVANAAASITVERVFAGLALVLTAIIGFLGVRGLGDYVSQVWILAGIFVGLYLLLFNRRVIAFMLTRFGKSVRGFYQAIEQYKAQRGVLVKLLIYSMAFQVCFVWITDLLYRALGVEVSFTYQLAFVAIISAITMIPISMNGLGVREGSYSYFFAMIGIAEATSITVSLLFYLIVLISTSPGAIFWLISRDKRYDATISTSKLSKVQQSL